jgi:hypothetical protein
MSGVTEKMRYICKRETTRIIDPIVLRGCLRRKEKILEKSPPNSIIGKNNFDRM